MLKVRKRKLFATIAVLAASASSLSIVANADVPREQILQLHEHVNRGNYLMARNQFESAIAEYEAALDIDAMNQIAKDNKLLVYNNWGVYLFRQRKYEEAKAKWEMALKLNPLDRNAKSYLSILKATLARLGPEAEPTTHAVVVKPEIKPVPPPNEVPTTSGAVILNQKSHPPKAEPKVEPEPQPIPGLPATYDPSIYSQTGGTSPPPPAQTGPPPVQQPAATTVTAAPGTAGVAPAAPQAVLPPSTTPAAATSAAQTPPFGAQTAPPAPRVTVEGPPTVAAPPAATATAATPPATPPATPTYTQLPPAGGWATLTIGEKIGSLEEKIYGRRHEQMSIINRLERLEADTCGTTRQGTVQERVDALKQNYGP